MVEVNTWESKLGGKISLISSPMSLVNFAQMVKQCIQGKNWFTVKDKSVSQIGDDKGQSLLSV